MTNSNRLGLRPRTSLVVSLVLTSILFLAGLAISPSAAGRRTLLSLNESVSQLSFSVSQPMGMVSDAGRNRLFVASGGMNQVLVWDEIAQTTIKTIAVGSMPSGMGMANGRVFVANFKSGTISAIDAATLSKLPDINPNSSSSPIQCPGGPINITSDPDTNRVYVALYGMGRVAVIDATTNAVIDCLSASSGTFGVAINPALDQLYVTNRDAKTLQVFDVSVVPARLVQTEMLGGVPFFVHANAPAGFVYVMVAFDAPNFEVPQTLQAYTASRDGVRLARQAVIGDTGDGGMLRVSQANGMLFAAATGNNQLQIIDPLTLAVKQTIAMTDPYGITENAGLGRMYIGNRSADRVEIVPDDLGTGALPTVTATSSPTETSSPTPTGTPSTTATRTSTPTRTSTQTSTPVKTPTRTSTPTRTPTRTATPTRTSTVRPTPSPTGCALRTVKTIAVGVHPKGVAADPVTNRVYVALFDSSSVAVVNAGTNQLASTWSTNRSGHANGIGVTGGKVFVTLRDSASVAVLDAATGGFITSRAVGGLPYGVGTANGVAWVANFGPGSVSLLDAGSAAVTATTSVGSNPSLVAPAGDRAFVTYYGGGVAVVGSGGSLLGNFKTAGSGSFGIAFNSMANRIYVSNRNTNQILMLDAASGAIIRSVTSSPKPFALAFNPDTNHLFVVLPGTNQVEIRDGTTLGSIARLSIGAQGASGGDGIAVLNGRVYVANNAGGTMTILADSCSSTPTPTATAVPPPSATPTATPSASATPTATTVPSGAVTVEEGTVVLNAYPYDSFWLNAVDPAYNMPYKRFDAGAYQSAPRTAAPRTFKTVILENDYLRLTFLPDLGGRLWQVLFKPTGQIVFYSNTVLKPSPWGPSQQGGWLAAGGMEWALPVNEHGYEWGVPWTYTVDRALDHVTLILADSTASNRVRATVAVSLYANSSYFVVHPRIENAMSQTAPVQFWVNAQLSLADKNVSPETEFTLASGQVFVHSTGDSFIPSQYIPASTARQPAAPMPWPLVAGRDLSFYRAWDNYLGVFVPTVVHEYAGAYSHMRQLGVVRVFPSASAPGVKLFAFGPNFSPRSLFTDDGSDYFELWGGLPRTFFPADDVPLAAGESREWDEYWIPFARTGGLSAATKAAVLSLGTNQSGTVSVGVAGTTRNGSGTLILYRDGAEVKRWPLSLDPGSPFRDQVSGAGSGAFKLRLFDASGVLIAETS